MSTTNGIARPRKDKTVTAEIEARKFGRWTAMDELSQNGDGPDWLRAAIGGDLIDL
jgi:hypothetical protein